MKKILLLFAALLLLVFLSACQEGENAPVSSDTSEAMTDIPETEPPIDLPEPKDQVFHDAYRYSNTVVFSGETAVFPVQTFLWTTQYEQGEATLTGDGDGFYGLFEKTTTSHTDLPVLALTDNVLAGTNERDTTLGDKVSVYEPSNTDEPTLTMAWGELSSLPVGEYIIVFYEYTDERAGDESILDYWQSCFQCVFKLVVAE